MVSLELSWNSLAGKAKDGTATSFNDVSLQLFQQIPDNYRKTLTLDNGSENSRYCELVDKLMLRVYFAKPYARWERGTNENTNRLLRRFFPKGTDFFNGHRLRACKSCQNPQS